MSIFYCFIQKICGEYRLKYHPALVVRGIPVKMETMVRWKLPLALTLMGGFLLWFLFFRTTPLEAFEKQMRSHVDVLNEYRHGRLKPYASAGLQERLQNNGLHLDRVVLWAHRHDTTRQIQYRFDHVVLFQSGDYAEARFLRSRPGGDFTPGTAFHLPWIYRDGKWLVASGFRDGRRWDYPGKGF
jgi:hypothetical protein